MLTCLPRWNLEGSVFSLFQSGLQKPTTSGEVLLTGASPAEGFLQAHFLTGSYSLTVLEALFGSFLGAYLGSLECLSR